MFKQDEIVKLKSSGKTARILCEQSSGYYRIKLAYGCEVTTAAVHLQKMEQER